MKNFETPEVNVVPFQVEDILTTSTLGDNQTPTMPTLPGT